MNPIRKPAASEISLSLDLDRLADLVAERVSSAIIQPTRVQPKLLGVKEAAIYLGRSEQSVQHLIFERELPVVRVGRRVHLDRADLDAWIEKNKY